MNYLQIIIAICVAIAGIFVFVIKDLNPDLTKKERKVRIIIGSFFIFVLAFFPWVTVYFKIGINSSSILLLLLYAVILGSISFLIGNSRRKDSDYKIITFRLFQIYYFCIFAVVLFTAYSGVSFFLPLTIFVAFVAVILLGGYLISHTNKHKLYTSIYSIVVLAFIILFAILSVHSQGTPDNRPLINYINQLDSELLTESVAHGYMDEDESVEFIDFSIYNDEIFVLYLNDNKDLMVSVFDLSNNLLDTHLIRRDSPYNVGQFELLDEHLYLVDSIKLSVYKNGDFQEVSSLVGFDEDYFTMSGETGCFYVEILDSFTFNIYELVNDELVLYDTYVSDLLEDNSANYYASVIDRQLVISDIDRTTIYNYSKGLLYDTSSLENMNLIIDGFRGDSLVVRELFKDDTYVFLPETNQYEYFDDRLSTGYLVPVYDAYYVDQPTYIFEEEVVVLFDEFYQEKSYSIGINASSGVDNAIVTHKIIGSELYYISDSNHVKNYFEINKLVSNAQIELVKNISASTFYMTILFIIMTPNILVVKKKEKEENTL